MRTIATLSFVVIAAAACRPGDEVTANANRDVTERLGNGPAGVYVLRSVAGESLPAVIVSHESYRAVMVSDTIFLHADGSGGEAAVKLVTEESPPGERLVRENAAFTYTLAGNRLTAEIACNDVIVLGACLAPPHYSGTLAAEGLVLDLSLNNRVPQRYTKVAGPSDVATVRITPSDDLSVAVGSTLQLSAVALDAQGGVLSGRTASWSSVPPSTATVTSGTVRGVSPGTTFVIAFLDGRADTVRVRVR